MARRRIRVVDDDPRVRESFCLILRDHDDVVDVPDGPSALERVKAFDETTFTIVAALPLAVDGKPPQ